VSTVLKDAGFKIPRIRLAQQGSETIIRNLVSETNIRRFRNVPLRQFLKNIRNLVPALYIIGLDKHVGFLAFNGKNIRFYHSTPFPFSKVIKENARFSYMLWNSKYRVAGNLADDGLIKKWITREEIVLKYKDSKE
jgi:hypothetical protein